MGREKFLERINASFSKDNKKIIVLSSFAGTGKSAIANQFGYMFNDKDECNYVYWMKSDANNLESEFKIFATELQIPIDR